MIPTEVRPALGDQGQSAAEAAVGAFTAELQAGLDAAEADTYDQSFAADVMWGSPRGAVLADFDELNAAHRRLMGAGAAPPSRFEVVRVLAPAPGVAIAHIRRQALEEGGFSEMALYVLVEREGQWWLAAAQNTPIAEGPA